MCTLLAKQVVGNSEHQACLMADSAAVDIIGRPQKQDVVFADKPVIVPPQPMVC